MSHLSGAKAPELALFSYPVEDYLSSSKLSQAPTVISDIDLDMGLGADLLEGEAEILLLVAATGEVDDILVLHSSLPDNILKNAIAQFRVAKLQPGVLNAQFVKSRLRIRLSAVE